MISSVTIKNARRKRRSAHRRVARENCRQRMIFLRTISSSLFLFHAGTLGTEADMIVSQALGFDARYENFLFFDDYDDKPYTRARALLLCLFHVACVRFASNFFVLLGFVWLLLFLFPLTRCVRFFLKTHLSFKKTTLTQKVPTLSLKNTYTSQSSPPSFISKHFFSLYLYQ